MTRNIKKAERLVIEEQRLAALEEIRALKYNYCHALDAKDWRRFATLFTVDGSADMREAGPSDMPGMILIEGRDNMMDYVQEAVGHLKTCHHVFAPLIEFDGDDCAQGLWQMEDRLFERDSEGWKLALHGLGHYPETYLRGDGKWKIHHVKLTRENLSFGSSIC